MSHGAGSPVNRLEFLWAVAGVVQVKPPRARVLSRADWLERDPRFAQTVTVHSPEICLGELLESVAEQTGVALRAEGDAADVTVTVLATDQPLVDLCLALHSLLSFRSGAWRWEPADDAKATAWRLVRPPEARDHAARVRRRMDDALIETIEEGIRLAHASDTEREVAARRSDRWKPINDPLTRQRVRALEAFLPTRAAREALVRERRTADFPASAWSDDARAAAQEEVEKMRRLNPQQGFETPDTIRISYQVGRSVTPRLTWMVGAAGRMYGGSVSGGIYFEAYGRDQLYRDWLLDGDLPRDAEREAAVVRAKEVPVRAEGMPPGKDALLWRRLRAFHAGTGVPLLARVQELPEIAPPTGLDGLPPVFQSLPPAELAALIAEREKPRTLRQALDANTTFLTKWRGPFLLATDAETVWQADVRSVPWELRRWIRANLAGDARGMVGFEGICGLALRTTPALETELERWRVPGWKGIPWPALPRELARTGQAVALAKGEALAWKALSIPAQDALRGATPAIGSQRPERVRLVVEDSDADGVLKRTFLLRVERSDGERIGAPMVAIWERPALLP